MDDELCDEGCESGEDRVAPAAVNAAPHSAQKRAGGTTSRWQEGQRGIGGRG
jgi:hypothetical protein